MKQSSFTSQDPDTELPPSRFHLSVEQSGPGIRCIGSSVRGLALVEPRLLIRESLSALLAKRLDGNPVNLFRISSFACVEELIDACQERRCRFGLVVLNIGARCVRESPVRVDLVRVQEKLPETPVVLFSDREDPADAREALARGVKGFIPTRLTPDVVCQALRLVQAGGAYIPTEALLQGARAEAADDPRMRTQAKFTRREWQVMERVRRGESNKAIAYALALHESTVKVYVRQIMRKLHATNRTHAAFLLSQAFGQGAT